MACNAYFGEEMPKVSGPTLSVNMIPFGWTGSADDLLEREHVTMHDMHHYSGFQPRHLVKTFFFVGTRMRMGATPALLVHYDRCMYAASTVQRFIESTVAAVAAAKAAKL